MKKLLLASVVSATFAVPAFAVTVIKEEVAKRAEDDKNFLLLRVFMIFSLENNKLWI